jgi:DNA-binding IclR family transcriptional regulator
MKGSRKQYERHVESVLAALEVMEGFLVHPAMSIKQIMDVTGFTRNRVMRLTGTLLHKGYMVLDTSAGKFALGPKILALGKVFEQNRGIVILARPILRKIALTTGESVSLYVREGFERVVMAREEGTQQIRYAVAEGQRMDLHAGAGGKVLLAFAPAEVLEAFLNRAALEKPDSRTISDKEKLLAELQRIRSQGFGESTGERVPDAGAVAAPVFDSTGDLVCALGIAGPVSRFTSDTRKSHQKLIVSQADFLSEQLGYKHNKKQKRK